MTHRSQGPTLTTLGPGAATNAPGHGRFDSSSSSGSLAEGRFVPGVILGGRYRIVALLGTGGMGEVYRANDLKLGQPVALKFLPEALAHDESRIARFYNEVRIARQVAHPNVCRVYDLGEAEGLHFLSMEYVDGEDLASLLRRIGRMPQDRAIQIARQLCAGLAAAHQQGFLHRDLKPANVMIDGRGNARITDFGLAAVAQGIAPREVRVGTPAYMAPEQLSGQQVSVKSDIYSLGLVLYELLTGRPPFRADTPDELLRTQQEASPPSLASVIEGIDPAVERAVLRCLESDPRHRPASALAVAAALPGGDPLAAALAAGEIPSPQMVADAGDVGSLSAGVGAACLATILLGLLALAWVSGTTHMLRRFDLPKPPEALKVEARELIERMGYPDPPVDMVAGFELDEDYMLHVRQNETSARRWDSLGTVQPSALTYWYRQSPRYLVPSGGTRFVELEDPPEEISGMIGLRLDPRGRLVSFLAVPPQVDLSVVSPATTDWSVPFKAAGLDIDRFAPVPPIWNPLIDCTTRSAWSGEYPGQPGVPIRVEGCSYGGRPAFFSVLPPWAKPRRLEAVQIAGALRIAAAIGLFVFVSLIVAGVLLARRNLRLGRSDRRGAFRLALFVFSVQMIFWLLSSNHVPSFAEFALLGIGLEVALAVTAVVWLIYIALEPLVRRMWPDVLISWNRLLAGRYRDPLVGRDLLIGGAAGAIVCLGLSVLNRAGSWIGLPESTPLPSAFRPLMSMREAISIWIGSQVGTLAQPIGVLFLLLLLRVLLRRQWAAVGATIGLFAAVGTLLRIDPSSLPFTTQTLRFALILLLNSAVWAVILAVLVRSGLLACVFLFVVVNAALAFPPMLDLSSWYAGRSWLASIVVAAVAVYAYSISRSSRGVRWEELLPH
ncbi:MAG TPA: serine/threonine-protein kinase [Patescibacteria group bacterium]|nr:serine/threonine-protein kinase [Patescibacteria group bacterium]